MEGCPRPLFCKVLEGKRTFQKDLLKSPKNEKKRNSNVHRHVREAVKRETSRNDSGHHYAVD